MIGRPLKFQSVDELERLIEDYFSDCDSKGRPYTITGLALALDTDRATLMRYECKEDFYNTIKKAKLKCENYAEEQLFVTRNTAGVIFNMKNNYGWVDKQEVDSNVSMNFGIKLPSDIDEE